MEAESTDTKRGSVETFPLAGMMKKSYGKCLKEVVKKMVPVVFKDKVGFPPMCKWTHCIDVGDAQPIKKFGCPLTPLEHEAIRWFIDEGIKEGVIEDSDSLWSSPLLPVPKKDGTLCICVNYRALNQLMKPNVYPLPQIEESYQNLAGAKYFTSLDLWSGYWQAHLAEEDKEKTAFTC